jgi:hypothetical protein
MIDTAGNINMTVYENGLLVWGKEPDGTAFSPPTWKMPTFTEPQFTLSGWNNALFKGASQNSVKPFTLKPSVNSQYKIVQNQNMLSITTKEDLKAGLFTLDGKFLKSISIRKNSTDIIDLSKVAKTSKLLQIACKKSLTRHMIYVW